MLAIIPNNAIPAATHDIDTFGPRIGVKAAVDISPYASFVPRASKQEFAAVVVSWGSSAGEPSAGLRSVFTTYNRETGMGWSSVSATPIPSLIAILPLP